MTVLITGANRGIGLALAQRFAAQGDAVIGTCRGTPPDAPGISWQPLDVADPASLRDLARNLAGAPLSLLVCNAGVFLDRGQQIDQGYAADLWAQTFAVNVTGVFVAVQALLPNLRAGRGKIGIISSQLGSSTRASGGNYIYRASKAAAVNLGRNLAADLRTDGIAVGIYHPGWVQTDMGGSSAEITPDAAASGLATRLAALSLDTSGCFETWDGRPHPL
jgi:NAD(P)-dependent dehydrogenase (short-subunit alcohol dehydrogenase family)